MITTTPVIDEILEGTPTVADADVDIDADNVASPTTSRSAILESSSSAPFEIESPGTVTIHESPTAYVPVFVPTQQTSNVPSAVFVQVP